jgi:hypothetical protein
MVVAIMGIAATLLAYAASPGVRRAVSHAERSVKHAVGHVFHHGASHHGISPHGAHRLHLVQPLHGPHLHQRPTHLHLAPSTGGVAPTPGQG